MSDEDKKYYEGLTGKECKVLPSLMIEDSVRDLPQTERKDIIIYYYLFKSVLSLFLFNYSLLL